MARTPRITLCWNAKTPTGWRYFVPLYEQVHGSIQVKHGWVKDKGQNAEYPNGRYVLRSRRDGKRFYTPLDTCNPRDAVIALQRARRVALAAGDTQSRQAVLKVAAAAYIEDCKARNAMGAYRDANLVLGEFLPLCKGIVYTRTITRGHVLNYHKWLRAKGNSDRTVWNKHNRLLSFLRFAKGNLSEMPPKPEFVSKLPNVYTSEETAAILAVADNYMRLVILMGLKLGLRELEIAHAEWSDVHWLDKVFRVSGKPKWDWKIKDSEERDIPIPADVLAQLRRHHKKHPKTKLVVGTKSDKPNLHLLRSLKRLAKRASLNCGQCDPCKSKYRECENWQLHKLRRTYLTTLLRSGFDLRTVQSYAGHADLASTMRYLRPSAAKESQDKVNAINW